MFLGEPHPRRGSCKAHLENHHTGDIMVRLKPLLADWAQVCVAEDEKSSGLRPHLPTSTMAQYSAAHGTASSQTGASYPLKGRCHSAHAQQHVVHTVHNDRCAVCGKLSGDVVCRRPSAVGVALKRLGNHPDAQDPCEGSRPSAVPSRQLGISTNSAGEVPGASSCDHAKRPATTDTAHLLAIFDKLDADARLSGRIQAVGSDDVFGVFRGHDPFVVPRVVPRNVQGLDGTGGVLVQPLLGIHRGEQMLHQRPIRAGPPSVVCDCNGRVVALDYRLHVPKSAGLGVAGRLEGARLNASLWRPARTVPCATGSGNSQGKECADSAVHRWRLQPKPPGRNTSRATSPRARSLSCNRTRAMRQPPQPTACQEGHTARSRWVPHTGGSLGETTGCASTVSTPRSQADVRERARVVSHSASHDAHWGPCQADEGASHWS